MCMFMRTRRNLHGSYGSSGQPAPDLHALHFPAGGRRFRPTLEEFLLFLDRENLFNDWKDGWKPRADSFARGMGTNPSPRNSPAIRLTRLPAALEVARLRRHSTTPGFPTRVSPR